MGRGSAALERGEGQDDNYWGLQPQLKNEPLDDIVTA